MPVVQVQNLTKSFGSFTAVKDLSISVEAGEILVIVGSSGCGKTTTLRCIAGLEVPTSGTIYINDEVVASGQYSLPPERRGVGMMFQSYALWPHMTVFNNVAYGLRLRGVSKPEMRQSVRAVLDLVGLSGYEDRYPHALSGGQQQRVALARSAVTEPKVLLLDEPLSNLDAKLRVQMRDELKGMIKRLGMTAVYITHDQTEAMVIADRIVVMRNGRVEQVGRARDLYSNPANLFVADFIGLANLLTVELKQTSKPGSAAVASTEHGLNVRLNRGELAGDRANVTLAIRPEDVRLAIDPLQGPNVWKGTVKSTSFLGSVREYEIDVMGHHLKAHAFEDFESGTHIHVHVDPSRVIVLLDDVDVRQEHREELGLTPQHGAIDQRGLRADTS